MDYWTTCGGTGTPSSGELANIAVALATLLVAIVAVFQQRIHQLLHHPSIHAEANAVYATFGVPSGHRGPVIFLRARIRNTGNEAARDTELSVASVSVLEPNGTYRETRGGDFPMSLVWSSSGRLTTILLPPGMTRFADIAHIHRPEIPPLIAEEPPDVPSGTSCVLALEVEPLPFSRVHVFRAASYRLRLLLSASNMPPVHLTASVEVSGQWSSSSVAEVVPEYSLRIEEPQPFAP
jgi:hypothetical protein